MSEVMKERLGKLSARYHEFDERFRALSLRERAMLGGGLIAVLLFVIDSAAVRPLSENIRRVDLALERTETDLREREAQLRSLGGQELSDEERRFREQKRLLEAQLREVDRQIRAEISELVPPTAIVSVLEELLAPIPALELIRLQSQSPHRIGSAQLVGADPKILESTGGLFRHGVQIEIEGSFAAALDFLEQAEASPWHLLWDRLEYEVTQFPTARITVDIHTISDQEEWLGV